jgi:hypothetical protein
MGGPWLPLPPLPFDLADPNEKTVRVQRQLRALWGDYIVPSESRKALETLAQVPVSRVEKIIAEQPSDWMHQQMKDAILAWWASGEMTSRLDSIAVGIENGTYL